MHEETINELTRDESVSYGVQLKGMLLDSALSRRYQVYINEPSGKIYLSSVKANRSARINPKAVFNTLQVARQESWTDVLENCIDGQQASQSINYLEAAFTLAGLLLYYLAITFVFQVIFFILFAFATGSFWGGILMCLLINWVIIYTSVKSGDSQVKTSAHRPRRSNGYIGRRVAFKMAYRATRKLFR
jgi:hypothetical protein